MSEDELSLKTFSWFIHKFNIHPEILKDKNDIAVIFNAVSKHKKVIDFKPIGKNRFQNLRNTYLFIHLLVNRNKST